MNRAAQVSRQTGLSLRWLLIAMGLCVAPIAILALVALSYLGLDANAFALRQAVLGPGSSRWTAKIELNAGQSTMAAVGSALRFARNPDIAEARAVLRAVNHASVGVYERPSNVRLQSAQEFLDNADSAMRQRGWSRLLCVVGDDETVLVYVSDSMRDKDKANLCMAVASDKHWVIGSAELDASALASVLRQYAGNSFSAHKISAALSPGKESADLRL